MIDIVIPYIRTHNDFELRYALRSIEENLRFDVTVNLVGDAPDWIDEVRYYPVDRIKVGKKFGNFFDTNNKLLCACENIVENNRFIYTNDDIFFLHPTEEVDIAVLRAQRELRPADRYPLSGRHWVELLQYTDGLIRKPGKRIYNYETHLPNVYEVDKCKELADLYGIREHPVQFATLYYNHFHGDEDPMLLLEEEQDYKFGVYRPMRYEEIKREAARYKVLNFSPPGFNDDMRRFLSERFPNKSRYER